MSRSVPDNGIELHVTDNPWKKENKRFYAGYDVQPIETKKQSKYDTEWMSVYSTDYMDDQGDNHYTMYDLDEPETH